MLCLRAATDEAWARSAVKDLDAVLIDHAHCEMKAASNALSLVVRHPNDLNLVRALTAIAQEELQHFDQVVQQLAKRGLALGIPPVDDYAAQLRRAMNMLPASDVPLVANRLLVGALIEARSCERFKLLLNALPDDCDTGPPPSSAGSWTDLRAFYTELFECEARHYRVYVDLAKQAAGPVAHLVEARLDLLAEAEARIVRALPANDARGMVHG